MPIRSFFTPVMSGDFFRIAGSSAWGQRLDLQRINVHADRHADDHRQKSETRPIIAPLNVIAPRNCSAASNQSAVRWGGSGLGLCGCASCEMATPEGVEPPTLSSEG